MYREEIARMNDLEERIAKLRGLFDIDTKRESIQEIEATMVAPDFWDDAGRSQEILKKRTSLEKLVQMWDTLVRQLDDVRVMIELARRRWMKAPWPKFMK